MSNKTDISQLSIFGFWTISKVPSRDLSIWAKGLVSKQAPNLISSFSSFFFKSRSERLKSGPESAGSSPARDKAFGHRGHRIFRRLRFLRRQVTPPFFASKYGIESTQAAELLCLFIYTGFCADCSAHQSIHQSTERCAAVLPSAAKDKSFQSNDWKTSFLKSFFFPRCQGVGRLVHADVRKCFDHVDQPASIGLTGKDRWSYLLGSNSKSIRIIRWISWRNNLSKQRDWSPTGRSTLPHSYECSPWSLIFFRPIHVQRTRPILCPICWRP